MFLGSVKEVGRWESERFVWLGGLSSPFLHCLALSCCVLPCMCCAVLCCPVPLLSLRLFSCSIIGPFMRACTCESERIPCKVRRTQPGYAVPFTCYAFEWRYSLNDGYPSVKCSVCGSRVVCVCWWLAVSDQGTGWGCNGSQVSLLKKK